MATMLITLGVIVAVCALFGMFLGGDEGFEGVVAGFFGGGWVGFCLATIVGFWWIVFHFVGKFW